MYIGELVRNRFKNVKNPETGKRVTRKAPENDLIVTAVPHLRIIDQKLWHAAHAVREAADLNGGRADMSKGPCSRGSSTCYPACSSAESATVP